MIQYFSIELYLQLVSFSWKYVTLHEKTDINAFPLNGVDKRFQTDSKWLTETFKLDGKKFERIAHTVKRLTKNKNG